TAEFALVRGGQRLLTAGTESATIAYPLLVLAITRSPVQAGLVTFARLLPFGIFALPAGLAADRWSCKHLMIGADMARAAAMATLAIGIVAGRAGFWALLLAAFIEGSATTFFSAAQAGAMRGVVSPRQLPAAAGPQEARRAIVRLGGAPPGRAPFWRGGRPPLPVGAGAPFFSPVFPLAAPPPRPANS